MEKRNGKVTLLDIAKATGVTVNTVSRALKNKPDISRATCEHIQQVAREMGYVRNYIASSLRSGRTKTIAMITGTLSNPYYAILADLLQREAFRLGYSLMILCSQDDAEMEANMAEMALSRQADGVLITPVSGSSPALQLLQDAGLPQVLLSRSPEDGEQDAVFFDDEKGGYLAGRHLIEAGHRRLAMISAYDVFYSTQARFRGFHQACEEAGVPETDIGFAVCREREAILTQLRAWKEQGITGLFSFCDVEAWNIITLLENNNLRVPDDFAVVGFDNIRRYIHFPRKICSVDGSLQEEATVAIDLLRRRIHEPQLPPQRVMLPVTLACHSTCV